jgi:hypothetical protein
LALAAAGCGGSGSHSSTQQLSGDGFSFEAPTGWAVTRAARSITARKADELVSVTIFRLARPVTPALRAEANAELDRVAAQLAKQEGGTVEKPRTEQIAGRDVRVYEIARPSANERIGFLLDGRREYQLYCRRTGSPCDRLFSSFTLSG